MTENRTSEHRRVRRERESALEDALRDCSQADWDGYGAAPANKLSAEWAGKALDAFPPQLGVPEIAFEPDGDVGLEWWQTSDRVLSVSVGTNGEVRYAARLGGARLAGTEMLTDGLPQRLIETALKLVQ